MSKNIRLMEVGPRDGLQSEVRALSLTQRQRMIEDLEAAGLEDIEIGSFVRNDWIPQLALTDRLLLRLRKKKRKARLWAFVPNSKGLERAVECGIDGVGMFYAVSDRFCRKNVNSSQKQLREELKSLVAEAWSAKIKLRVYLSTSFHCPYAGYINKTDFHRAVGELLDMGVPDVAISDTTGRAHPKMLEGFMAPLIKKNGAKYFSLHLHNTQGMALANTLVGLQLGIRRFDSSLGGMGGCPYAPGATGNLATEDLVLMLQGLGYLPHVKLARLLPVSQRMERLMGRQLPSSVLRAGIAK